LDEIEYRGDWWLPEDPDKQIPGTLTYNPNEGFCLELDGSFKSFSMYALFQPLTLDHLIILGLTRNGKLVTLYKCYETVGNDYGYEHSYCLAEVGVIGRHFQQAEDIKFIGITANYAHLPEWTGLSGFSGGLTRRTASVTFKFPKPIAAKLNDMTVTFGVGFKSRYRRQIQSIEQTGYIQFTGVLPIQWTVAKVNSSAFRICAASNSIGGR